MWTCSDWSCACNTSIGRCWCVLLSCGCGAWKRSKLLGPRPLFSNVACRESLAVCSHWHRWFVCLIVHCVYSLISCFHLTILIFLIGLVLRAWWMLLDFRQNSVFLLWFIHWLKRVWFGTCCTVISCLSHDVSCFNILLTCSSLTVFHSSRMSKTLLI